MCVSVRACLLVWVCDRNMYQTYRVNIFIRVDDDDGEGDGATTTTGNSEQQQQTQRRRIQGEQRLQHSHICMEIIFANGTWKFWISNWAKFWLPSSYFYGIRVIAVLQMLVLLLLFLLQLWSRQQNNWDKQEEIWFKFIYWQPTALYVRSGY